MDRWKSVNVHSSFFISNCSLKVNKVLYGGVKMRSRHSFQFKMHKTGTPNEFEDIHKHESQESISINDKIELAGKLAAGVAHEIRNPLTSIKGFVQLLSKEESKPEYFSLIYSEIDRVEEIINKLMKLGEPHSMQFQLNDVGNILGESILSMKNFALLKNINIVTSIESDIMSILCDKEQLQLVFDKIIKNAIEATPSNKNLYITCKKRDTQVHIMVKDYGVGIPKARLARIFEPFYCIKENGTGFGLMFSHKIVKEHHGNILIESELGQGTTVDIYLPLLGQLSLFQESTLTN